MWTDVLEKPKQGEGFRVFRGDLINVRVDYNDNIESKNTSDRIEGVTSEEWSDIITIPKNLSYSEAVMTESDHKKVLSIHTPQECVQSQ